MTAKRSDIDTGKLIHLYLSGKSINTLSQMFDCSRPLIDRRLRENGISIRSRSESELLKWSQMTNEQRMYQTQAAQHQRRGQIDSKEVKEQRAITRANMILHTSEKEFYFADLLKQRNIPVIHQFAIGPYNCDLTSGTIAMEIQGNCPRTGRYIERQGKRTHYILHKGFNMLFICADRNGIIGNGAADYVLSYFQQTSRDKSLFRQYRVIGSTGKLIATGTLQDDDWTVVQTLKRAFNVARTITHRSAK